MSKLSSALEKYSPELLTGLAISGFLVSVMLAVKANKPAIDALEEEQPTELKDELKIVFPYYAPAAGVFLLSTASVLAANSINNGRNAALIAAYAFSEGRLRDYAKAVTENVGKTKASKIRDESYDRELSIRQQPKNLLGIQDGTLCFDLYSGRYFKVQSSEVIRRAANDIRESVMLHGFYSLNEYYADIDMDSIKDGDRLGWDEDDLPIEFHYSSRLTANDEPCLVVDYPISYKYV